MKVDKSNILQRLQRFQTNQLQPKSKQEAVPKNDQVQISRTAKQLQKADAQHEARIKVLAEQVQSGTYQVDAKKLSRFFVEQIQTNRLR
jgi:anti-sigma28 factor (negative regulator of flagellin synthesis)